MVLVPAVLLGFLVVFCLGYVFTETIRSKLFKQEDVTNQHTITTGGWVQQLGQKLRAEDGLLPIIGGIAAVLGLFVTMLTLPMEGVLLVWISLTIAGFGFAVFLNEQADASRRRGRRTTSYRSKASSKRKTRTAESQPPPPTGLNTGEDPYRTLLARVKYDQALADRLIEEERARMPFASLDDLCRAILSKRDKEPFG